MWHRYCFLLILVFLPFASGAQFNIDDLQAQQQTATIILEPSFPGPGDTVKATVDAGRNVFGAEITWIYNGTELTTANNMRSAEFVAGAAGTSNQLTARLTSAEGGTQAVSTTISPLYLDLVIEPQTRVPDWYWGRALPSYSSQINATALIHNGTNFLDSDGIVYTWRIDKETIENGAIRGGNKVSFSTPRGQTPVLFVTAANLRGETIASRAIRLNSVKPEMIYYEKHSLYGQRNISIKSAAALIGNVLTLQAEPYFLDTRVYNNPDIAQWGINSITTDNGASNPYEITLSRAGLGGSTIVNFHVRSMQQISQGVEESIRVNF